MAKCKLCPHKKVCRGECYGDQPCDFALAFDRMGRKLDLKAVCIESLQNSRNEALKLAVEHRIIGDYVLTRTPNAFNEKVSWWLTKRDCTTAVYCFTTSDQKEVEYMVERIDGFIRLLESTMNVTKICESVYDISLMAQHMIEERRIEVEDSRELFSSILAWAREFEAEFSKGDDDGSYMELIEEYAEKKLLEAYRPKTTDGA